MIVRFSDSDFFWPNEPDPSVQKKRKERSSGVYIFWSSFRHGKMSFKVVYSVFIIFPFPLLFHFYAKLTFFSAAIHITFFGSMKKISIRIRIRDLNARSREKKTYIRTTGDYTGNVQHVEEVLPIFIQLLENKTRLLGHSVIFQR